MTQRRQSIRDILLLLFGTLTFCIALLAGRAVYVEWKGMSRIESLSKAAALSDRLFDATEKLSVERDVAATLLRTRELKTVAVFREHLKESRAETDAAMQAVLRALEGYTFAELVKLRQEITQRLLKIREFRLQIDRAMAMPPAGRDKGLARQWDREISALIERTQDLWSSFVGHFTNIHPVVTQHLRYKHLLRIILDYTGRERAIIGRLIAENADPSPEEFERLLHGSGVIGISWDLSRLLAGQSGLYPSIAPYYKDAHSHYLTLHDMIRNIFYVAGARHGAAYPLSADLWLELSTQSTESLTLLRTASVRETQRYINELREKTRQAITLNLLFLGFALGLCGYSFRIIIRRVISPINAMVEALLDAMQGKAVEFLPPTDRDDEIGKLARVLSSFQQNVERTRQAVVRMTESENRMRAVVDHALNGIITINERGIVESFNPACERLFGYKAPEVIGQNIKMLMPPPYHREHDGYLSRYINTGEARIIGTAGREVRALRKDGSIFPIELSVCEFHLEDGRHFSGIIHDITDRKDAESRLLSYTRALELSNKELDDFAYIASHDLKEPLRGIHNHSRFLLEDNADKLDEDSVGKLNRLIYLSQRMERLVNDLLYFSRLGRQELAIQSTDLNEVVHDIETMLAQFLAERGAQILIPRPLPVITCDKPRVTELLRNLITNAVKYNDKDKKIVEIGFAPEYASARKGVLRNAFYVRDNGRGIAPEFHDEIFRIFRRLQSSKDGAEEGTGVGLTFVKKIVERHNGRICLESTPGEGATFYFTLEGQPYDTANAA